METNSTKPVRVGNFQYWHTPTGLTVNGEQLWETTLTESTYHRDSWEFIGTEEQANAYAEEVIEAFQRGPRELLLINKHQRDILNKVYAERDNAQDDANGLREQLEEERAVSGLTYKKYIDENQALMDSNNRLWKAFTEVSALLDSVNKAELARRESK